MDFVRLSAALFADRTPFRVVSGRPVVPNVSNILMKLGAASRTEAVSMALRRGLV